MHAFFRVSIAFTALVATGGCFMRRNSASPASSIPAVKGSTRTAFALRYIDVTIGTGAALAARQCVYAHYTGWLTNGTKFDSSRDTMPNGRPKNPLAFPLGVRRVIAGWDVGFDGMKVGGQRRLFIPYQLAYGEAGRLPVIPPKSELIFDVELLAIADTLPHAAASTSPAAPTAPARADTTTRRPATPPQPQCPTWATVSGGR